MMSVVHDDDKDGGDRYNDDDMIVILIMTMETMFDITGDAECHMR